VMSFDITRRHERTVPKLSQRTGLGPQFVRQIGSFDASKAP
jgi:hypothetical protein